MLINLFIIFLLEAILTDLEASLAEIWEVNLFLPISCYKTCLQLSTIHIPSMSTEAVLPDPKASVAEYREAA